MRRSAILFLLWGWVLLPSPSTLAASMAPDSLYQFQMIKTAVNGKATIKTLSLKHPVDITLTDGTSYHRVYVRLMDGNHIKIFDNIIHVDDIVYIKGKTRLTRKDILTMSFFAGSILIMAIFVSPPVLIGGALFLIARKIFDRKKGWRYRIVRQASNPKNKSL